MIERVGDEEHEGDQVGHKHIAPLEITRALATNPTFLLLDEPFANIDPIAIRDVQQIIRHLAQKGTSILITDHNAREIFSVVDCHVMLGGTVDELIHNEEARTHYLGADFSL